MSTHLADVSIRSLLLVLMATIVLAALRRRRTAALQHAVWASVVCGMLGLFAFGAALPRLSLPVMPSPSIAPMQRPPMITVTPLNLEEGGPPVPTPADPFRSVDWNRIAFFAYVATAFAFLARFLTGLFMAKRLVAKSTPVGGFRESRLLAVPITVGWFRPEILLPLEWRQWDLPKLNTVLTHEASHVRRHDGLIAAFATINRCVFWFNPLAWWLERRLGVLAELACDDFCVATMGDPEQYAQLLLEMACVVEGSQGRLRQHVLTMAAGSHIRQRIELIRQEGRTFSRGLSWTVWAAIAALGLPMMLAAGAVQVERQAPLLSLQPLKPPFTRPAPPPAYPALLAQNASTPAAPRSTRRLRFEVASIRPTQPTRSLPNEVGRGGNGLTAPAAPPPGEQPRCIGRYAMNAARVDRGCVSLRDLLLIDVFAIPQSRLIGPDWMDAQVFDISAKLPDGATAGQLPEMFQTLLEDRFGLAFHREQKQQTVYALVLSKGGLKVRPAADSTPPAWVATAERNDAFTATPGIFYGRPVSSVPGPYGEPATILRTSSTGIVRFSRQGGLGGIRHWEAPNITMEGLADLVVMAGGAGTNVVDMTGLKGRYQLDLAISSVDYAALLPGRPDAATLENAQFSVLQEGLKKLGLQLEARKAPVETIIVDRLAKTPTPN